MEGLTSVEAKARLALHGPNELPHEGSRRVWQIVFEVLREPMLLMLLLSGVIYIALGSFKDAGLIVTLASASVVVTIVQEFRSERVLGALRDLTSPRALVIRDGEQKRIPGREIVPGDRILLKEGDRVPADAVLISSESLEADESLLTGEAVAVRKAPCAGPLPEAHPGGDNQPFVYSSSLIIRGQGAANVIATGVRSEIGKIGKSLASIETASPPLQTETRRLVRLFAVAGVSISIAFTVLYGLTLGNWLSAFLGGIALSMALLPEEFPVVLTVFLAIGAWRITRAGVLTRRAAAIETLGAATVLCSDKTGTLTENRMAIVDVRTAGAMSDPSHGDRDKSQENGVIAYGRLASQINPFDPMEKAFHLVTAQSDTGVSEPAGELIHQYPLSPPLLAMSNVWRQADGTILVAAKGAPEAIFHLCRLSPEENCRFGKNVDEMARKGLRILGIARASIDGVPPAAQDKIEFEFVGLVGLADPIRPHVPAAIRDCRSAGIRVIMITGDYPVTARAIAQEAGLDPAGLITGIELASMGDATLAERVRSASVFARVRPEQKTRIVQALKASGEIVAMTGDGVNDAPSLKAAHIGIAMGNRGTDVAREASAIVLLQDDFGSIVHTIKLGRRIFDNIRKAMGFVMAAHIPIAGIAMLPLLFGLPIILLPIHIAFLELVVDPVCSVAFEAEQEERDIMIRPPRNPKSSLFSGTLILWSLLQGTAVFAATAAVFWIALSRGMSEPEVRSLAFVTLVIGNVVLILAGRSFSTSVARAFLRPNPTLWVVLGIDAILLALILGVERIRMLFNFGVLHLDDVVLCLGIGLLVLVTLELIKRAFSGALRR